MRTVTIKATWKKRGKEKLDVSYELRAHGDLLSYIRWSKIYQGWVDDCSNLEPYPTPELAMAAAEQRLGATCDKSK